MIHMHQSMIFNHNYFCPINDTQRLLKGILTWGIQVWDNRTSITTVEEETHRNLYIMTNKKTIWRISKALKEQIGDLNDLHIIIQGILHIWRWKIMNNSEITKYVLQLSERGRRMPAVGAACDLDFAEQTVEFFRPNIRFYKTSISND